MDYYELPIILQLTKIWIIVIMSTGLGNTLYPAVNKTALNANSGASELATVKSTQVAAGLMSTIDPRVIVLAEIKIPVSPLIDINLLISEFIVSIS